jgi:hypothetical protein
MTKDNDEDHRDPIKDDEELAVSVYQRSTVSERVFFE